MTRYVIAPVSRLHEGEGVLSQMPRIPISEDSKVNESFFYIDNRLVHEQDGSRILGPYNADELGEMRRRYESVTSKMLEEERKKFPFVVFEFRRTE